MSKALPRKTVIFVMALLVMISFAAQADEIKAEEWQEDMDFLLEKLIEIHPEPFARISEAEFLRNFNELREAIPGMERNQIVIGMMKLIALVQDGHTSINPFFSLFNGFIYPVRLFQFEGGVYIVAIPEVQKRYLAARVLAIGELDVEKAMRRSAEIVPADNRFASAYYEPQSYLLPIIAQELGAMEKPGPLKLRVQTSAGETETVEIGPIFPPQLEFETMIRTIGGPAGPDFATLPDAVELPRHLDHKGRYYWYEVLPDGKTVYFQFRAVSNHEEEPFVDFYKRMFSEMDSRGLDRLVIDIRYNGGGNGDMLWPFIYELIKREQINQMGNLFVITGRETFSAAVMAAARLRNHTNALLVGEPAGAGMNHYGDATTVELPNSGIPVKISTLYWQEGHPADTSTFIAPDYPAPPTSESYFAGEDPALEAILANRVVSMEQIYLEKGLKAALQHYQQVKKDFGRYDWWKPFSESAINRLGYELLHAGESEQALRVFKINTEVYPQSGNVWDSLAEAHLHAGNLDRAEALYKKSLEINPENENGREMLKEIQERRRNQ